MPQTFRPALAPGEREVLHEQGAYSSGRTWRLGQLCLTNRRLLFGHIHRQFLEIDLGRVEDMGVQKRAFMLASRPCIALTYQDGAGGRAREVWIVNGHVEKWQGAIAGLLAERGLNSAQPLILSLSKGERFSDPARGLTGSPRAGPSARKPPPRAAEAPKTAVERPRPALTEMRDQAQPAPLQVKELAEVARLVDQGSARMLWHFWKNRHHTLHELQAVLGEASHMGVLARIKEVVNPMAVRLLGRPILVFERSHLDRRTGEQVLNSWWLNDEPAADVTLNSQFVDVLDEGDHFLVILELACAREEDIRMEAREGRLTVAVDTEEARHYEEVLLPAGVDTRDLSATYRNGILQVRLSKEAT